MPDIKTPKSVETKPAEVAPVAEVETREERLVRAAVKSAVEETTVAMLAFHASQLAAQSTKAAPVSPAYPRGVKCSECHQQLAGCKNEHEAIVIYPTRYPQFADGFDGVYINEVRYCSNDATHKVVVPKSSVGEIMHRVISAEEEEVAMRTKRKFVPSLANRAPAQRAPNTDYR